MKNIWVGMLIVSLLSACGGDSAQGQALGQGPQTVGQAPAPASDSVRDIIFTGTSPDASFQLKEDEYETVYENREVPDTCTREVPDGYETECTPTTRRECRDEQEYRCTPTTRQECSTTTRRECSSTTRRECRQTTRQECSTTTRRECHQHTHQVCSGGGTQCHDVPDRVCHTNPQGQQVCQSTTRRVCEQVPRTCRDVTENQCVDVPDRVCRSVPDTECRDVPDTVCRDVPDRVCRTVPDQDCGYVTRNVCRDVDDQVCRQVPRYRTETYACTTTVQVPVQQLSKRTTGNVTVHFGAIPAGVRPNETLTAQLSSENVTLAAKKVSGLLVLTGSRQQSVQQINSVESVVTSAFAVTLFTPAELAAPIQAGIADVALTSRALSLSLGKVARKEFLAIDLTLTASATGQVFFNGRIPAAKLLVQDIPQTVRARLSVRLADLGIAQALPAGKYTVSLRAGLLSAGVEGLIDGSALRGVQPVSDLKELVLP